LSNNSLVPNNEIHTFSVTDDSYSEDSKKAKLMAKHIGSNHHEFIFETNELFDKIPSYIYHEEDINYGIIYSFFLCKFTKKFVTVVLSGNGSDEIFAGYERYKGLRSFKSHLNKGLNSSDMGHGKYTKTVNGINNQNALLEFEQSRGQLQTQLKWADRFSMAYGLEARVPFLSKALVDYANKISMNLKIKNGVEKHILRDAAKSLKMPETIRKRPKLTGGNANSMPKAIPDFERYCKKLMPRRKKHVYDRYFDNPAKIVCMDVLNHIFVKNQCQPPNGFGLNDLY
jgi:asparagine synthase (glutamine-hydrolysing)